jgi:AmmeMemoRadiSam system protein B
MKFVRQPAVAGMFYPADAHELATLIDQLLDEAPEIDESTMPVAVVAPHAGYAYSGPTAAAVYRRLRKWAPTITRVVVVGPAHRVPVHHLALSSDDAFATPLGEIAIDLAVNRALLEHGAKIDDRAHGHEHSIEVHLPFLQRVLGDGWSLVPMIAGSGSATAIADALTDLWGAEGTLVVISSDLSHYHDLHTARRLDRDTAAAIVAAAWEQLGSDDACGAVPLRGALELARRHGEQITMVDLRTSADTAGTADRVVGYGSFVVR